CGSTRAELHAWEINIERGTASCQICGSRQLQPMQPKLDVGPLAHEVAELIINRRDDTRLKWQEDGSVLVRIGVILPKELLAQQTIAGRRKRFRAKLDELLSDAGWRSLRANTYAPPNQ